MILQPIFGNNIKLNRFQRPLDLYKKPRYDKFVVGNHGIQVMETCFLNNIHLTHIMQSVSKFAKEESNRNRILFKMTTQQYFKKAPKGSRMGKGSSKISTKHFYCPINKGQIIIEWSQLSISKKKIDKLIKSLNQRLPVKIRVVKLIDRF